MGQRAFSKDVVGAEGTHCQMMAGLFSETAHFGLFLSWFFRSRRVPGTELLWGDNEEKNRGC